MSVPKPLDFDATGWLVGVEHVPSPNNSGMGSLTLPMNGVVEHTQVGNHAENWFAESVAQVSAHFCVNIGAPVIVQCVSIHAEAWAEAAGNNMWYSIEHGDDGNPARPLSQEQIEASAQVYEALEHVAGFGFDVTNSTGGKGYGAHFMGGAAWGGHSCPDNPPGGEGPRSHQRQDILNIAKQIRAVRNGVKPKPHAIDPGVKIKDGYFRHVANGTISLDAYAKRRGTTWAELVKFNLDPATPLIASHRAAFVAYTHEKGTTKMPNGLVFYTHKP